MNENLGSITYCSSNMIRYYDVNLLSNIPRNELNNYIHEINTFQSRKIHMYINYFTVSDIIVIYSITN